MYDSFAERCDLCLLWSCFCCDARRIIRNLAEKRSNTATSLKFSAYFERICYKQTKCAWLCTKIEHLEFSFCSDFQKKLNACGRNSKRLLNKHPVRLTETLKINFSEVNETDSEECSSSLHKNCLKSVVIKQNSRGLNRIANQNFYLSPEQVFRHLERGMLQKLKSRQVKQPLSVPLK